MWAGNPAAFVRALTEDDTVAIDKSAESFAILQATHADQFTPYGSKSETQAL